MLADEPTGNLDEGTGGSVLALLDQFTWQAGKNLLMVTHNPESAAWLTGCSGCIKAGLSPVCENTAPMMGS